MSSIFSRSRGIGSSPRAWRQHVRIVDVETACRFISTCVETASPARGDRLTVKVHLHVRGDGSL